MKNLLKKYPKQDFNSLLEKHIIYFCRDALSFYNKDKNKQNLEKEILDLIKSKDWDWNAKDIDGNTILTYPIYNNAHSIVDYLLSNKKYNICEYNKEASQALGACINLVSDDMISNILNKHDINIQYKNELVIKAYKSSSRMNDETNKNKYLEVAFTILKKGVSFNDILNSFITETKDYDDFPFVVNHFLDNHPLAAKEKLFTVKTYFIQDIIKHDNSSQKFISIAEKWMTYQSLNNELTESNKSNKKLKI